MSVICKYCNKEYVSQSSRSNHIKKYHKQNDNQFNNHKDNHPKMDNQKSSVVHSDGLHCKKCNKIFTFQQNRWRHEQKCNLIKNDYYTPQTQF
jgi:hypothetical protein